MDAYATVPYREVGQGDLKLLPYLLGCLVLTIQPTVEVHHQPKPNKKIKVRLTAYWVGQDQWTNKLQSSTGRRLISGRSCAVDPKVIPYGSTLIVEGKEFVAIDTGTAVLSRKASNGRYPVVDLFYKSEKQAMLALDNLPTYAWVELKGTSK